MKDQALINAYKQKTVVLIDKIEKLLVDTYQDQGKIDLHAREISRECNNISLFAGSRCPEFINQLMSYSSLFANGKERPKNFRNMMILLPEIKSFDWASFVEENSTKSFIDFDGLFNRYKEEEKLGEAIDKVIRCFQDILSDPSIEIDKKMRVDLETIISIIQRNKYASDSAIRTAIISGWEFAQSIFPFLTAVEKYNRFAQDLYDANTEVTLKLNNIALKIYYDLKKEFVAVLKFQ